MDNSSQDQLITEIQDPTPAVAPSPQPPLQQVPISQPPNSSSNGTIIGTPTQQPTAVRNTPDVATSALRQKLLEELRLGIRDISQKVVEMQLPLREAIAKVQEKMSLGVTPAPIQDSQQTAPSQESPIPPPALQQEVVSQPMQSAQPQSFPSPVSEQTMIGETAAVPRVSEVGNQDSQQIVTAGEATPQGMQQAEVPIYTDALHTLSETGVNLLRGIVELDNKQPGPEPTAPLTNRKTITDKDLVEFLLDENNDPKLKDFGDMKVVRKIMREKLGLPSEAVNTMPSSSNPDPVQASVSEPLQTMENVPTIPQVPQITETSESAPPKEEVVAPEQLTAEPTPIIPPSSEMPSVGSDPYPVAEQTPTQFVPVEQTTPPTTSEKGSVMGFLHKLFKKSS